MKNNCIRKQRREHAFLRRFWGAGFLRRGGFHGRNNNWRQPQFRGWYYCSRNETSRRG